MDLSVFYDECQQLPENERQWVDVFYQTVVDVFGESDQDFMSMHKVRTLFYGKGTSLSKAQYYRKRNLIRRLYDWLADQDAVDDSFVQEVYGLRLQDVVSDSELSRYYFQDLDSVLAFIRLVGSSKGMGSDNDLLNIKSIVILLWYQIEISEIPNVRKSDLDDASHAIVADGRRIVLNPNHFAILRRFADSDVHKGFPSQKLQIYVDSPYLIRSAKQVSLSVNNIQKAMQRFNAVAVDYGKELSILNLRRNGIFNQVYLAQDEKTANSLIKELIGCDTAFAFGYKEFYKRWKRLMIGGDEVDSVV